ncbi:hypothetical protein BJ741DRAFT_588937 [Chytriomyces cf. hyalinus JEL632]|nr:hypothetical protein BJ741DRAFT_588937 [Chytriomyces cf. hyalinus JEL632]
MHGFMLDLLLTAAADHSEFTHPSCRSPVESIATTSSEDRHSLHRTSSPSSSSTPARMASLSPCYPRNRMDIEFLLLEEDDQLKEPNGAWPNPSVSATLTLKNSSLALQAPTMEPTRVHLPDYRVLPPAPSVRPLSTKPDRSSLPRRFPCTVPGCSSRFTRKHHMVSHLVTHCEGKPFLCEISGSCKASFRRLQDLRRHVKTVRHDL